VLEAGCKPFGDNFEVDKVGNRRDTHTDRKGSKSGSPASLSVPAESGLAIALQPIIANAFKRNPTDANVRLSWLVRYARSP